MEVREQENQKEIKELWRKGKASIKIRCLRCREYFVSESASIRTCKRCRNSKDNYMPVYHFHG